MGKSHLPTHKEVVETIFENKKIKISLPKEPSQFSDVTKFINSPEFENTVADVLAELYESFYTHAKKGKEIKEETAEFTFRNNIDLILKSLQKRAKESKFFKE